MFPTMGRAVASGRARPKMESAVARRARVRQSTRAPAASDQAVSTPPWAGSQARSDRPRWSRRPAPSRPASAPGRPVAASSSSPSLRRHDCHHRVPVCRGAPRPTVDQTVRRPRWEPISRTEIPPARPARAAASRSRRALPCTPTTFDRPMDCCDAPNAIVSSAVSPRRTRITRTSRSPCRTRTSRTRIDLTGSNRRRARPPRCSLLRPGQRHTDADDRRQHEGDHGGRYGSPSASMTAGRGGRVST